MRRGRPVIVHHTQLLPYFIPKAGQQQGYAVGRPFVSRRHTQVYLVPRVDPLPILRHEPVDGRHVPVPRRLVDGLYGCCSKGLMLCWLRSMPGSGCFIYVYVCVVYGVA